MNSKEKYNEASHINYELLIYYSNKFQRLRVDRSHGVAPHKPILLLSVIQLIDSNNLQENRIYLQKELTERFHENWYYLGSENHHPDTFRPFFHLRGDGFWHHIPNPGFRKVITSRIKLSNFIEVKQAIKYAYIDDALFELLRNSSSRDSLTNILVTKWFKNKQDHYESLMKDFRSRVKPC
jgi:putative restriction endonuclease